MAAAALIDKHCPADPGIDATRDNGFELPLVVVQFVYGVLCDFFFCCFSFWRVLFLYCCC